MCINIAKAWRVFLVCVVNPAPFNPLKSVSQPSDLTVFRFSQFNAQQPRLNITVISRRIRPD